MLMVYVGVCRDSRDTMCIYRGLESREDGA
jgi:hypothetical protein